MLAIKKFAYDGPAPDDETPQRFVAFRKHMDDALKAIPAKDRENALIYFTAVEDTPGSGEWYVRMRIEHG